MLPFWRGCQASPYLRVDFPGLLHSFDFWSSLLIGQAMGQAMGQQAMDQLAMDRVALNCSFEQVEQPEICLCYRAELLGLRPDYPWLMLQASLRTNN